LLAEIRSLGPIPTEDEDDGLSILLPATEEEIVAIRESCNGACRPS
jgi:hypothetical protein